MKTLLPPTGTKFFIFGRNVRFNKFESGREYKIVAWEDGKKYILNISRKQGNFVFYREPNNRLAEVILDTRGQAFPKGKELVRLFEPNISEL